MKTFRLIGLLCAMTVSVAVAAQQAEYWLDADPGLGHGVAIVLVDDNGNASVPTSSLQPGVHTLGVRAKQAGVWGQTYTHRFYVLTAPNTAISGAEWWLDADPGHGQATAVAADGTTQQVVIPFTTTGLTTGIHTLGVRMRQGDTWGQTYTHRFMIIPDQVVSATIETVEASWDFDVEHAIAIPFTQEGDVVEISNHALSIDELSNGVHTLCICAQANGKWTIIAAYEVTKSETPTGLNGATEAVVTYKVLRNDQVLIIRQGKTYTLQGVPVR